MPKGNLQPELESLAKREGIQLFGIADLRPVADTVIRQGGTELGHYNCAISIGVGLSSAMVDLVAKHDDRTYLKTYHHHVYQVVNPLLDIVAFKISLILQNSGYRALPIPASQRVNEQELIGLFSHKLAANLAGLGWIGKSCLLITPQFGPRVRFATVLTDAPFDGAKPLPNKCGKCRVCVENCPAQAFTGVNFDPNDPREKRFDPWKCEVYRGERERDKSIGISACGICVNVCPHGKRAKYEPMLPEF